MEFCLNLNSCPLPTLAVEPRTHPPKLPHQLTGIIADICGAATMCQVVLSALYVYNLIRPLNNLVWWTLLPLFPFYKQGKRGTERWSHFPKLEEARI